MREVGGADEHGVDVLAVEYAAIVADDVELLGKWTIGVLKVLLFVLRDLASHRELHVFVAGQRVEHATGAATHADDGHPHAVAGALPGKPAPGGGGGGRGAAVAPGGAGG